MALSDLQIAARLAHDAVDERDPYRDVDYDGKKSNGPTPLSVVAACDLVGLPPVRRWHVDDLIPAEVPTLLNGDGGTGKSLLALQLGASTVLNGYWAGRAVAQGSCLYLSAEDDLSELHRRLADIAAAENVSVADLRNFVLAPLAGDNALLAVPEGKTNVLKRTPLFEALEARIDTMRPTLTVLDTLADLFGGEENQRAQARQFVGMLRGLCLRYSTTILLLAHPSLAGMASGSGSSGSTAWNNSVRSRLYLDRVKGGDGTEDDPDVRVLRTVKANYGRTGHEIKLRWQAGTFVPHGSGDSFEHIAATNKADRLFMELLTAYEGEGRYVSATPSANYAPAIFAKDPRADGIRKPGFTDAMNRLFESKKIALTHYGPPSKDRRRIARV
jgi:RecA-family ATPase